MTGDFQLAPVPDEVWPEDIADMRADFAGGLNVYRVMAHHPPLLRAWSALREHVVNRTSLGAVGAEVVILRAAYRLGSSYEWAQHVIRARAVGLDDARILSLRGQAEAMAPEDALLAGAVDELLATASLHPATLAPLADAVGKEGVLDLMVTVGFYSALGFMLNTFGTPLDGDIARQLAEKPIGGVSGGAASPAR